MEARKLTSEEIDKLYLFFRNNQVKYFEVQSELVDHIGSAIEKKWEKNPVLPFEEALQNVSLKFGGRRSFVKIAKIRGNFFIKNYNRLIFKELINPFYITLTILLSFSIYISMSYYPNNQLLGFIIQIGMCIIALMLFIYYFSKVFVSVKKNNFLINRILLRNTSLGLILFSPILFVEIPSNYSFMVYEYHLSSRSCLIFAITISLVLIYLLAEFMVQKSLRTWFNTQYPQFAKA